MLSDMYFLGAPLQEYFVDKDSGLPLAGGTIDFYIDDSNRTTRKDVYELTGVPNDYTYTALPNPLTLSSVGTVQDNSGNDVVIYYFPYVQNPDNSYSVQLYYIVVRDVNGVEQFSRPAWPNIFQGEIPTPGSSSESDNQLSNPQFTRTFLNQIPNTATIYRPTSASNTVFNVAPDWDLVVSGTGTIAVTQLSIAGIAVVPTNPPYALNIVISSGISTCLLRQRLNTNSGLWGSKPGSTVFLAASVVAFVTGGSNSLDMYYDASSGLPGNVLILNAALTNTYASYSGGATIPASTDTNIGSAGYVDIYFDLSVISNITLTSVQVVPVLNASGSVIVPYTQVPANRQFSLMGDYYLPRLNFKPIPSLLVGWDFPLNPAQWGDSQTMAGSNAANYLWDQTIGAVATADNTVTADAITDGFQITTNASVAVGGDACYILQYLSGSQAMKMLGTRLSVNVNAYTTSNDTVIASVHLYRGSSSATVPAISGHTTIISVNADGSVSSPIANWTEIPRSGLPTASAKLQYVTSNTQLNSGNDFGFNGWEITDSTQIGNTSVFAIVVTFSYLKSNTVITVNSISLVPGDIPTRPAPQALDEVLRECKYYYEQSYAQGVAPGSITPIGQYTVPFEINEGSSTFDAVNTSFTLPYQFKRSAGATITMYSPAAVTVNRIQAVILYNGSAVTASAGSNPYTINFSSVYTITQQSADRAYMLCGTTRPTTSVLKSNAPFAEQVGYMHYVVDARLGVV